MRSSVDLSREASAALADGDAETSLRLALEGLDAYPADPELLRLAGRSSLDLGRDDAVPHFEALVAAAPAEPTGWVDLGFAHAATGDAGAAADAFAKAMELAPEDPDTVVDFALAAHAAGRAEVAIDALVRASESPGAPRSLQRSLLDLARSAGHLPVALTAAKRLAASDEKDAGDALDVAEIHLEMGQYLEAAQAFAQLRHIDDEHEVFACHGQLEALTRAGRWRDALDVAIATAKLDRHGLTTDLLAFVTVKMFGEGADRPHPEWSELEAQLEAGRTTHRRLHAESRV